MVIHTLQSQGPEITIVFSSGASIEAGKTKIKFRDVEVGLVESVGLADDLESVVVTARLDKAAAPLLREDTQFWVVRPRVGPGGVSGARHPALRGLHPARAGDRRGGSARLRGPGGPAGHAGGHPGPSAGLIALSLRRVSAQSTDVRFSPK